MRLTLILATSTLLVMPALAQTPDRTNSANPSMGDTSNHGATTVGAETTGAQHGDMHFKDNAHPEVDKQRNRRDARQDHQAKASERSSNN